MKGYFRKRGDKWSFTVDIGRDPVSNKRLQKTASGFSTKKEAQAACAEMIAQVERGEFQEQSKELFGDFLREFMDNRSKQQTRASTFHTQMNVVNKHIVPELGKTKLRDMTPMQLEKFYKRKLDEGLRPSYIRSMHAIITKTLNAALTWELVSRNVASLASPPRVEKTEIQTWSIEQANHYLEASQDRRLYIVYVLAIYTGMRRGEILGLRWEDVDFERGRISVRQTLCKVGSEIVLQEPKTKSSRRLLSVPEFAMKALSKHKARQNEWKLLCGAAFVHPEMVCTNKNGTYIDPGDVNSDFKMAAKLAHLPQIRFHDLRHTHATLLLRLGENPKIVSERLGHANVGITLDTYSHVLPDMQQALADKFDIAMKKSK